jgi:hypothetical protein
MTTLANTCEGTDSVAVTNANSVAGTDQFSSVVLSGAGNTLYYSNYRAHNGTTSIDSNIGATAGTAYATWAFSAVATAYSRAYVIFEAAGTATRVIAFYDAAGTSLRSAVYVSSVGLIYTVNAAGSTVATASSGISLDSWVRIEFDCTGHASAGVITCRIYKTADSFTPTETLTNNSQNTGGTIGQVRIGSSDPVTTGTSHLFDDIGVSDAGQMGPVNIKCISKKMPYQAALQRAATW